MEHYTYWYLVLCSILLLLILFRRPFQNGAYRRPPGPRAWPVIGNMLDLGATPHRALYELRPEYGPVLWLALGSVNTMVVQTARSAAELFKRHDGSFCDRTCPHALTALDYRLGSLAVGSYGPYCRAVRRLCMAELVNARAHDAAATRRRCVDDMVRLIAEESGGEEVELSSFLFLMAFNVVGNMTLSRNLVDGSRSEEAREFYDAMCEVMELAGTPNMADSLAWTRRWNPQGLKGKMEVAMGTAARIVAGFVKERIEESVITRNDFLDTLLTYQRDRKDGSPEVSDHNVIIILLELFLAGSDTTSSTLEWAMTELLRHPETMKKAKQELDRVIGLNEKVNESDIDQLLYLQAVIKETFRLHPPIPLLLPRNTLKDTEFMGYTIPKDTQVFVNAWAIGRDPDAWDNPTSFVPDRFMGSGIDYKGKNFELIPFGSGRRMCVATSLAPKVLHLALASLLHCFEWELGGDATPKTIDMNDRAGITVRKLVPLRAIPKKRRL